MTQRYWNPEKTVFVQISDGNVKAIIDSWATDQGFEVYSGIGYDLIAVGYLFAIVDMESVGKKAWSDYLDYLQESEDNTPCVVIGMNGGEADERISNIKFELQAFYTDPRHYLDGLLSALT